MGFKKGDLVVWISQNFLTVKNGDKAKVTEIIPGREPGKIALIRVQWIGTDRASGVYYANNFKKFIE